MNRSTFHKGLARATVAVVLTISAIGCATAPDSTPTPQTPPNEISSEPTGQRAGGSLPEVPEVSLQSPVTNLPEPSPSQLEEPSPVWIDDTLARRTPLQPTELALQPPAPDVEARTAVARPAPASPSDAESEPVAADPDGSLALIEPRVPALQRPASAEAAASPPSRSVPPPVQSATAGSIATGPTSADPGATARDATSRDAVTPGFPSSGGTTPADVTSGVDTSGPTTTSFPTSDAAVSGAPAVSRSPETTPQPTETLSSVVADQTPSSTTSWNERATTIGSGSEFSVVLPGSGWLYVGKEYGDGEISLLGKSRSNGDEVFRFRIGEPGDYGLWFQQQDSLSGSLVNERLAVRAGQDEEANTITLANVPVGSTLLSAAAAAAAPAPRARSGDAAAAASDSGALVPRTADGQAADGQAGGEASAGEPIAADGSALDRALRLLDEGDPEDALAAFADGAHQGEIAVDTLDDALVERFLDIARAALGDETGRSPVIRSFWRAIASSGSAAAPEARRALLEIAARTGDPGEIAASISALDDAGEASVDDMMFSANALLSADRDTDALPLLARAVIRDSEALDSVGQLDDDRLFALARLLERPGPDRDLSGAAALYRLILDDRPLSAHWDASRSRLEYLRRHYFEVR